jgi:acyl-CoA thioesterase-1
MNTVTKTMWSVLLILLIGSWSGCERNSTPNVDTNPTPEPIRYLALGDSYTIGESVSEAERFPIQLSDRITGAGIKMDETTIIAQTGWTTTRLIAELEAVRPTGGYDLVTLLIGVNNQFRRGSIDVFEQEFRNLVQWSIALADNEQERVIIVSIPDYAFTPFGQIWGDPVETTAEIDQFNALKEAVAAEFGIAFINITDISRRGLEEPELVASDGLHPSGEMYRQWVDRIYDQVETIFE